MSYIILSSVMRISKYMWLMFYLDFKIFIFFLYFDFLLRPLPVNNDWRTSSGMLWIPHFVKPRLTGRMFYVRSYIIHFALRCTITKEEI
jgi:hypothetical protein